MEPLSTIRRGEKKGVPSSYAHDGGGLDAGKKKVNVCLSIF